MTFDVETGGMGSGHDVVWHILQVLYVLPSHSASLTAHSTLIIITFTFTCFLLPTNPFISYLIHLIIAQVRGQNKMD